MKLYYSHLLHVTRTLCPTKLYSIADAKLRLQMHSTVRQARSQASTLKNDVQKAFVNRSCIRVIEIISQS